MSPKKPLLAAALFASLALAAAAPPPEPAKKTPAPSATGVVSFRLEGETRVLANGMTFVFVPRPGAPTFAGYVAFRVGGVNSVPGDSGLAHMFEHMAFKGTEHIGTSDWVKEEPALRELRAAGDRLTVLKATGKGDTPEAKDLAERVKSLSDGQHAYIVKDEFDRFYTKAGARNMNASTGMDLTQYFVELPGDSLELWMMMESQRVREPVMREFYSERDVIFQERLMRTENDPVGKLYEAFLGTAFQAHPYRIPGIGYASDIRALTMVQAETFFHSYYSPSNAIAVVVGNVDRTRVWALAERYFATIPRRGDPPPLVTREPAQEHERRVEVPFDANPVLLAGFHKPTWPSRDDTVLDVVSTLLGDGVTSRLYRRLVEKEGSAAAVQCWNGDPGTLYDNLFVFLAFPSSGVPYASVEKALWEELDRLKSEPVSEAELQKAKTRILAGYVRRLDSNLSTATLIGSIWVTTGDWKNIEGYVKEVQTVNASDVARCASAYFTPANRTVATVVPAAPAKEEKP